MSAATALRVEDRSAHRPDAGLAIALRGLTKSFDGGAPVIRGLDLTIPAGQFVAVVGRSGCGKSTLLRLILGLEEPTAGRVTVDGGAGKGAGQSKKIMFQEPRLLPWARVLANVEVGLGRDRAALDAKARVTETLRAVGLEGKADVWPGVLSGGQKQRVALARALVSRPRFLALDEPLGALDALTRIEMQSLLEQVWSAQGFTAVLVTHDVAEAITLADRVVMLEEGRITLDISVDLPRPRRRGSVTVAALEEKILAHLVREEISQPEYAI